MIDWSKPIEWDNGEEAHLWPTIQSDLTKAVSACSPWERHAGEDYVHVCGRTGAVLGCEEDYPRIRNRKPPASMRADATPDS
jgi:hypothetical protein